MVQSQLETVSNIAGFSMGVREMNVTSQLCQLLVESSVPL